jgi:hypothetical protein
MLMGALVVSMVPVGAPTAGAIVICQRKNTITLRTACKKKETQVTLGADSVPTVPNATNATNAMTCDNANKLGGKDPSAFEPLVNRIPLTTVALGAELQVATAGPFAILFNCNNGSSTPTAGDAVIGIKNIGEDHSIARSTDDSDMDFNTGEKIYFDFEDPGDTGYAISPSGWILQVNSLGEAAIDAATPRTIGDNKCVFWATYTVIAHP